MTRAPSGMQTPGDPLTGSGQTNNVGATVLATSANGRLDAPLQLGGVRSNLFASADQWSQLDGSDVDHVSCTGDDVASVHMKMTDRVLGGVCPGDSDDDDDLGDDGTLGDLNQYVLLERLGKGAQGEVFLAMDTEKNELRAVKAVKRPAAGARVSAAHRKKLQDLAREVAIMKRLRHRNVVALHEVIDDPAHDAMFLVLQYVEHGPLATLSDDGLVSAMVDPVKLVSYARQVCSGLDYLHRNGVIHRDIKPENILRGANDTVYLADFGVSESFETADDGPQSPGRARSPRRVAGTRGTPAFLAPELLALDARRADSDSEDAADICPKQPGATDADGAAVDVWALGITLYALLYGKLPWEFTDARDLFDAIQRRPIELRPAASSAASTALIASAGAAWPLGDHSVRTPPANCSLSTYSPSVPSQATPPTTRSPAAPTRQAESVSPSLAVPPMPDFMDPSMATSGMEDSIMTDYDQSIAAHPVRLPARAAGPPPPAVPTPPPGSPATGPAAPYRAPRPLAHFSSATALGNMSMTGPMARSFLPQGVMPSDTADEGWRRVLFGMLQRDPQRRSSLATIRRQLATLERRLERLPAATPIAANSGSGLDSIFTPLHMD